MNDRTLVFAGIKKALDPLTVKTPLPDWDNMLPVCDEMLSLTKDPVAHFIDKLRLTNGIYLENTRQMADLFRKENALVGYCDPYHIQRFRKDPVFAGIRFEAEIDNKRIDDYAFGITWASLGIAESGTIVLKDSETSDRLGALAPWIHVALLSPRNIQRTLLDAIVKHGADPAVVWVTGPSKTADVEGILVQGVHGPGIQACFFV